jgi:hypothetical protein
MFGNDFQAGASEEIAYRGWGKYAHVLPIESVHHPVRGETGSCEFPVQRFDGVF